jgi:hypothetical protein
MPQPSLLDVSCLIVPLMPSSTIPLWWPCARRCSTLDVSRPIFVRHAIYSVNRAGKREALKDPAKGKAAPAQDALRERRGSHWRQPLLARHAADPAPSGHGARTTSSSFPRDMRPVPVRHAVVAGPADRGAAGDVSQGPHQAGRPSRAPRYPRHPFAIGSLGHGLGLAAGLALGKKLRGQPGRVFCLLSDGEWNEGSNWESLTFIAHRNLREVTCWWTSTVCRASALPLRSPTSARWPTS